MVTPRPFQIHVPDEVLQDLRVRLGRVRWPDEPPLEPWSTGSSVAYMQQLVDYWREQFDWRAQEAMLNRFRQFTVPLAGIDLHFIHEEGRGPNPMPLLLSHGWPGSVVEFPGEILRPPRSLAERTYTQIRRWTKAERGGHFAALEQPEVLVHEVREFFRPLR